MKKIMLILFFGMLFGTLKAQVRPLYFYGDSIITDSTKATSYGIFGKLSNEDIYVLKRYDFYDNLLQTGTFKDDSLKIPHGKFSYYNFVDDFNEENGTFFYLKQSDRYLSDQGSYSNGFKVGRWITFYPDGKILAILNYVNGLKNGEYKVFDRKGRLKVEGQYLQDLKSGTWKTGKKIETYTEGRLKAVSN